MTFVIKTGAGYVKGYTNKAGGGIIYAKPLSDAKSFPSADQAKAWAGKYDTLIEDKADAVIRSVNADGTRTVMVAPAFDPKPTRKRTLKVPVKVEPDTAASTPRKRSLKVPAGVGAGSKSTALAAAPAASIKPAKRALKMPVKLPTLPAKAAPKAKAEESAAPAPKAAKPVKAARKPLTGKALDDAVEAMFVKGDLEGAAKLFGMSMAEFRAACKAEGIVII